MPSGTAGHRTVLLHEAVEGLGIRPSDTVVDATLGGTGHARAMLKYLKDGCFIGFDADIEAIERARAVFASEKKRLYIVHANFRYMRSELEKLGITKIDKVLFDLGWSGYQLAAGRGFSFLSDEPLSMTYDKDQALSASGIVNDWKEESLADVIYGWGEERYARRIARAIAAAREKQPIRTAKELADIVRSAVPAAARYGRIHPATKTFQAIRIAVNDELGALEEALRNSWQMLSPGGRIAVVSFHSLEDRIVKQRFADWEDEGEGSRITRKPITPCEDEIRINPRSRSAKLRIIEKHGNTKKNKQI
jgi:16S rRNA (cytosine1402-N4)-methyltransferase